jgi:hypothetical protein
MSWPAVYVVMDDDVLDQLAGWHLPDDDRLLCAAVDNSGPVVGPARPYRIALDRWGAIGIDRLLATGPGFALTKMRRAGEWGLGPEIASVLVDVRERRLLFHYGAVALDGDLGASHVEFRLALCVSGQAGRSTGPGTAPRTSPTTSASSKTSGRPITVPRACGPALKETGRW